MKTETENWINNRILECERTLKRMGDEGKKSKIYYGITQELNALKRVLRIERKG